MSASWVVQYKTAERDYWQVLRRGCRRHCSESYQALNSGQIVGLGTERFSDSRCVPERSDMPCAKCWEERRAEERRQLDIEEWRRDAESERRPVSRLERP